jgi:hypothetical protein
VSHVSYFVALFVVGSFAALLGLEPLLALARDALASARGLPRDSEGVKIAVNLAVAGAWALVLIGVWIRNGGLSPRTVKPGGERRRASGHLSLLVGHALVGCVFFVKAFAFLLILPVIGVLVFYTAGIALLESTRDRVSYGRR